MLVPKNTCGISTRRAPVQQHSNYLKSLVRNEPVLHECITPSHPNGVVKHQPIMNESQ
jgi:hypothetical protein